MRSKLRGSSGASRHALSAQNPMSDAAYDVQVPNLRKRVVPMTRRASACAFVPVCFVCWCMRVRGCVSVRARARSCAWMCMHAPTGPSPSRPLVFPSKLSLSTGGGEMIAGPPSRGPTVPEALVGVAPAEAESGATSGNTAATAAAQPLARKSRHSQERRRGAGRCARCVMQTAHCITSCTASTNCTASSRSAGTKTGLSVVSSTDSVLLQQTGDGTLRWHENVTKTARKRRHWRPPGTPEV